MDIIKRMQAAFERVDGWVNLVTGIGTRERSKQLTFQADAPLPDAQLEAIYVGDPYAAIIAGVVPEEALRQGYRLRTGDAGMDGALAEALEASTVDHHLIGAWTWSRVFGGGAIFVGADDGRDPAEPLDESAIRSIRFLTVLDRTEMQPDRYYNDPLRRKFGEAETYRVQQSSNGGTSRHAVVHESRLVRFTGGLATRRRQQVLKGWGESELNRIVDVLAKFNGAFESSGSLLMQASEGVFKINGLMAMMAADKTDLLKTRLEMMDLARGVTRSVLIGENEDYTRTEVGALTGVAQVIDKNLLLLSGAARIPVTILMGQSPAGLSATGDSDIRWFYDRVKSAQRTTLRPRHLRLARLLCLAKDGPTDGRVPERLTVEYAPLWQPTPTERATERLTVAQADQLYVTMQAVTADEVAAARFGPDGWSPDLVADFDDRDDVAQADADAARLTAGQGADHAEGAAGIIAKVAARELPRDAGVALLCQSMGMDPAAADQVMGEAGKSFFTAPESGHAAEMDSMRGELAKAQASQRSTQQMLTRVLERNRAGELVVGNVIAKAPTELAEGEALAEGDVVEVPVADSRVEVRRVDGRSDGVAVVLQLPPELAAGLPTSTPAADLHVTLAYLGMNDRWGSSSIDRVVAAVRQWALTVPPIAATLGGIGRFAAGPDGDPVYVPVDSEAITDARPALVAFLRAAGFGVARGHGFTPHLTLDYMAAGEPTPAPVAPVAVTFPTVSVWWDSVRVDIELTGGA